MTWSPRNRTDDGSEDGDEKADEEAREDDDISIGECFYYWITGLSCTRSHVFCCSIIYNFLTMSQACDGDKR